MSARKSTFRSKPCTASRCCFRSAWPEDPGAAGWPGRNSCCRCRCCDDRSRHEGSAVTAEQLMRAPIVLLPVLLFLAGLVQLDGYKLVRMRVMLALVATGALAAGLSYVLNNLVFAHFHGSFVTYSRYVSPWIEESLKAALLVFLIRTRRVGLPVDAGIAGFAIGTGFAVVEN